MDLHMPLHTSIAGGRCALCHWWNWRSGNADPGSRLWHMQRHGSDLYQISYMVFSKNSGTPKSSILIGFSFINHPFWGTPIFGNTHMQIWVRHTKLQQKQEAKETTTPELRRDCSALPCWRQRGTQQSLIPKIQIQMVTDMKFKVQSGCVWKQITWVCPLNICTFCALSWSFWLFWTCFYIVGRVYISYYSSFIVHNSGMTVHKNPLSWLKT